MVVVWAVHPAYQLHCCSVQIPDFSGSSRASQYCCHEKNSARYPPDKEHEMGDSGQMEETVQKQKAPEHTRPIYCCSGQNPDRIGSSRASHCHQNFHGGMFNAKATRPVIKLAAGGGGRKLSAGGKATSPVIKLAAGGGE